MQKNCRPHRELKNPALVKSSTDLKEAEYEVDGLNHHLLYLLTSTVTHCVGCWSLEKLN
jgi:hypothetical protein